MDSDFYEKVYRVARKIPHGKVTSYGAIAKAVGSPQSARIVGYAMSKAHNKKDVPAHRVVNRNGLLTGKHHFSTSDAMENLLKAEGVSVVDDKIEDFKEHFWNPGLKN